MADQNPLAGKLQETLNQPPNRVALRYLIEQIRSQKGVVPFFSTHTLSGSPFPSVEEFALANDPRSFPALEFGDTVEAIYTEPVKRDSAYYTAVTDLARLIRSAAFSVDLNPDMEQIAEEAGRPIQHVVYPNTPFGFFAPEKETVLIRLRGHALKRDTWNFTGSIPTDTQPYGYFTHHAFHSSLLFLGFDFKLDPTGGMLRQAGNAQGLVHYAVIEGPRRDLKEILGVENLRLINIPEGTLHLFLRQIAPKPPAPSASPEANSPAANMPIPPPRPDRFPDPKPSEELIQSCKANETVLFTGSGLSARAGLPTWRQFVGRIIELAEELRVISQESAAVQREALQAGEASSVADNLASAMSTHQDELLRLVMSLSGNDRPLPRLLQTLTEIQFSAILSINYDLLLDRAFAGTPIGQNIRIPSDEEQLSSAIAHRKPFLLKLYGSPDRPESLIFSPAQYQEIIARDRNFAKFVESLFYNRSLLVIGVSLDGIIDLLRAFPTPAGVLRRHYALVAVHGQSWRAKAEHLLRRYNLEVIPYTSSENHEPLDQFLEALADAAPCSIADLASLPQTQPGRLTNVILQNIGPFEKLDIPFDDNWKILLGDNGVGKSSILKAIALAIIGEQGRHYAGRLIRAGQTRASVILLTEKNPSGYLTEIFSSGSETEVVSRSGRPLEIENWVALAFPPLRAGSWEPSPGPQPGGVDRPTADDVLPILRGDADPRMDKLKQWIVNYDIRRREKGPLSMEARALDRFFELVGELTGELRLRFVHVDERFRVIVQVHEDPPIPLEAISQGMTSLLSWVGILVQRLFEIRGAQFEDPTNQHAIVLMDEIDAHMHPEWQRTLVEKLRTMFPNVQFLTSTHSPLILAGRTPSQVARLKRVDGKVQIVPVDADAMLGRTDQILTNDGFGLTTTLSPATVGRVEQYKKLLANPVRTEEEEDQFFELEEEIERLIPPSAESKEERRLVELLEAIQKAYPAVDGLKPAEVRIRELAGKLSGNAMNGEEAL